MIRRPPRSTRTDTLFPYTTLFRSQPGYDTALVYVSDHGESLGEDSLYLHGVPRAIAPSQQTQVPMVMWFSPGFARQQRSEEHTSELQSLMRISYAVLCLKKKKKKKNKI